VTGREVFLGIDLGTSGARAAAVDGAGNPVAWVRRDLPSDEASRRNPGAWAHAVEDAVKELRARIEGRRTCAVSVDATSGTVLGLGKDGRPVGEPLMYDQDVRRPEWVRRIAEVAPRESAAHGASSGLIRSLALQERPGVTRILHQADWLMEQVAGRPTPTDESNALKTGYDPVARKWPAWIRDAGLDPALLPAVLPSGAEIGRTAGSLGLPADVPLIAGFTDGCASFWATGAERPGDGVTALGSSLTLKLLSDRPVFAPTYGIYSHRVGDRWLAGGASNSGGAALLGFFTPERVETLSKRIDPMLDSGLDYVVLPRPGERFPVSDPDLAPRTHPRPKDDIAFLHGLLEGVARTESLGYRRLAEHGAPPLSSLRSVGGGAANPAWTRMRLRILGVKEAPALSTEAAVGTARLARSGVRGDL